MKTCCEICGKETNDKLSFLELQAWEFEIVKKEKKDFYFICFECFNENSDKLIEKDTDKEVRKQRSLIYAQLVKEGALCPVCDEPLAVGHICQID